MIQGHNQNVLANRPRVRVEETDLQTVRSQRKREGEENEEEEGGRVVVSAFFLFFFSRCNLIWSVNEEAAESQQKSPIFFNIIDFKDHRYAFPHIN